MGGTDLEAFVMLEYAVGSSSNLASRMPTAWTLQGSNDGTTWDDLDTRSGVSWATNESKLFVV